MAGFEDDALQEGIDELLATIRAAILAAEPSAASLSATASPIAKGTAL